MKIKYIKSFLSYLLPKFSQFEHACKHAYLKFYNINVKCILESDLPTVYFIIYIFVFAPIPRLLNYSKSFVVIYLEIFLIELFSPFGKCFGIRIKKRNIL